MSESSQTAGTGKEFWTLSAKLTDTRNEKRNDDDDDDNNNNNNNNNINNKKKNIK